MENAKVLFEVPIEGSKGKVVGKEVKPQVYVLEFTSPPDNRLLTNFCQALILGFDIIETKYKPGVVITTSGIPKFYSNGLDLDHASFTPHFFTESLYALWHRVLTFPMPTIAWINGHAFAGAFMLAMMHDYRIMNPHKGFLCLNELELGAFLRPPMTSIFREKLNAATFRRLILEAARLKALDALKEGVVDGLGGLDEVLTHIDELKLVQKAKPGMNGKQVYGELKREMYRETIDLLENFNTEDARSFEIAQRRKKTLEAAEKKVKQWEAKSKL